MGASGSGKTTLLNCISTIDTATNGHIYLDGKDILEIKGKRILRGSGVNHWDLSFRILTCWTP